ncbi:MAG TPA: GNAT family N-acetyltransferase [Flexilinea sp.]|mgnify:FL=1|nr:GNAT family N-acetyltransferase [Flexilinea sp.]
MISYKFELEKRKAKALNDDGKQIGSCIISVCQDYWVIDHTYVDPEFRGQNIASELVKLVVQNAREMGMKILPVCPFAQREFEKKSEYQDVLYRSAVEKPSSSCPVK